LHGWPRHGGDFRETSELSFVVRHKNVAEWQVKRGQEVRPLCTIATQRLDGAHAVPVFSHNDGQHESIEWRTSRNEFPQCSLSGLPDRTVLVEDSSNFPERPATN